MYVSSKATMVVDFQAVFGKFNNLNFSNSKYLHKFKNNIKD